MDKQNAYEDNWDWLVLVNAEKQYSIWPEQLDIPAGWKQTGSPGSKEECLAQVADLWRDMRPFSLRALG
ncbi:MbtH family protein [Undibacterium curvum]|uniref:MbtH family NRPS accessory protein n=1 Tax=Undibacterium curvum TaxID=2762294 RepID=A0ABR7A945_9BURK|nr:MbtH family NRPS accessory protein [Undibacterium curvum]MBC3933443.1 MbtH family NRPS accessory protein [Undibacterium curvum]